MDVVLIAFLNYCNIELTVLLYTGIWHPKSKSHMLARKWTPRALVSSPWQAPAKHQVKERSWHTGKGDQGTAMTTEDKRGSQKSPQQPSCKRKLNHVLSHRGDLPSHLQCSHSNRKETHPYYRWMDKVTHCGGARTTLLKPRAKLQEG